MPSKGKKLLAWWHIRACYTGLFSKYMMKIGSRVRDIRHHRSSLLSEFFSQRKTQVLGR
jgi:hypothetical protein